MFSLFFILFFAIELQAVVIPSEDYTHRHVVDEENPEQFVLFWKLLPPLGKSSPEIQFECHCKTSGWVGFGVSPNGGMKGADLAIGWVKNGIAYLKDCYATDKVRPLVDAKQDWMLISGAEKNGYTVLKFKRKLETCDFENDLEILVGTTFGIFAWNDADPVTGDNDWLFHGRENRFTASLPLRDYKTQSLSEQNALLPEKVKSVEFRMQNIRVPKQDTYYHCQLFQLPKFDEKEHLVQFEMLVNPKYKRNVHHLLVYECEDSYVPNKFPYQHECGNVPLDNDVASSCLMKMIVAWGIGGQMNYSFPQEAGYPFTKSDKNKYLLLEMHYDNPAVLEDIVDNSGIKFYFTRELRQHDLGLLTLGTDGNLASLQIPPNTDSISFTSICHSKCTEKYLPAEGITVVGALLHTHLLGTSVSTALVRKDTQIGKLFDNPHYDFDYQFIEDVEPTKLYKGDALITQCKYSSLNRTQFTHFGHSTKDEMCFDFMYYYPRMENFLTCLSMTPTNAIYEFYYSLINDGLATDALLKPDASEEEYWSLQAGILDHLKTKQTYSKPVIERFKKFFASKYNKTYYCGGSDYEQNLLMINELHYEPLKVLPAATTCTSNTACRLSFRYAIMIIFIIFHFI